MNRREALAALVSLPATTRISVAQLKPEDVVVIECDECISQDTAERIKRHLKQIWPNHQVVVLGDGLKLKIASGA